MVGTIIVSVNDLSPTGQFDASSQLPPYNKLSKNMLGSQIQGRKLGLKELNLYYSWPNIRSTTSVTIGWKIGGSFTNYTWTLPANTNYESIKVLNESLQTFCIANGLYLIDGNKNNVYYLEIKDNSSTYKIGLGLFLVPTSLPVGTPAWTQPANFAGYPTVSCTPTLTISTNSEICNLLGFLPGTYDGGAASTVISSTYIPQLNPVSSVLVTCNICKNDVPINGSTVVGTFTVANVAYGSVIEVKPNNITYYDVDSDAQRLEIAFYDQNFLPIYIQDPHITVMFEVV